jgi:DNA-binding beta-propeller fold protein YncE
MNLRRRDLLFGAAAAVAGCRKQRGFSGYAFVANEEGRAIAVVDLQALALVRHVALNAAPTAVLSHPGRDSILALTPETGTIHEIGVPRMQRVRQMYAGPAAHRMSLSPDQTSLWALSAPAKKLSRISLTETLRVEGSLPLAPDATDFDLSPYRDRCAVAYGRAGSVQMFDLKTGAAGPIVKIADEVGALRFRSDGDALLVANLSARMLSVLEAPGGRVITNLPLAVRPDNFCFHPNGGQLFITGEGMDAVVVVYPHYVPQVAETALAGRAPGAMAASDSHLFVTSPTTGDVIAMDVETRRVIAIATVGAEPGAVILTPGSEYALVLNRKSGDMAVILTSAIAPTRRKSIALLNMIPVGSKPVAAVVRSV